MARIQLVLPDEDRDRFFHEAQKEGISLSEWLRRAGRDRATRDATLRRFSSTEEVVTFFEACDAMEEEGIEPDWEQHQSVINASRRHGTSDT